MINKPQNINNLFSEIKQLIEKARQTVAVTVNAATTALYWNIGERINREILGNKRAEYGKEVVKSLSRSLTGKYGKGWSEKQLRHCLRFAETFPDKEIIYALSRQLSWTHFRTIMYLKDELRRDPYFLNFLGLEDRYSEKTLEDAILWELEKFILELGLGFTFVERQKRMLIDGDSFKLDLLFYVH